MFVAFRRAVRLPAFWAALASCVLMPAVDATQDGRMKPRGAPAAH
jgi:hypothetical protein